tara:strand:+ start:307 stop:681 length:375 start_codon:yes stop_codon:yes gene_type:complete
VVGLFSLFGRSREMQQFDWELRAAGIHPKLVADAVKTAALGIMKDFRQVSDRDYVRVAQLMTYCILGGSDFTNVNDVALAGVVEERIMRAVDSNGSLDAQLILLALHSGVISASVVAQYGLEAE